MADPLATLRDLFPRAPGAAPERPGRWREAVPIFSAVAVAFVLWFTFSMRETYSVSLDVPLRVARLPDGVSLREPPPDRARVQLLGEGWDLLALGRTPPEIPIYADGPSVDLLRAATQGGRLPSGVVVQGVQPGAVELVLDERVTVTLPIALEGRIRTVPPYGLLRSPALRPDSVRVSGARSVLARLRAWPTQRLDREGVRRSFTATVALSDTFGDLVSRSASSTRVTALVEPFTEAERTLAVQVEGVPPGVRAVRLIPDRVRATFLVPTEGDRYDRALADEAFVAVVQYADILRDSTVGTVPVTPRVPADLLVRDVRIAPRRLEYFTVRD